ncbi:hypothetical protein [Hymenobacter yonginensis]|uniref:Histidine kinase N-terminal 7TM region domain-containing protein n=1 Tax=Hymenobacter yonginensis TaxID=748197 RepID=A0ABY7PQY4_9BACT|nr:hypothetical protein [Hymenobacter yonginensis]WBO85073.1 hypothetical protein O9Z63_02265 [Hymenobacter yonginensis]
MPDLSDIMYWLRVLYLVCQASILIPVVAGLIWRRRLPRNLRSLVYCCLMWLVLMSFGEYASWAWGNNNGVYQLVDILEPWFIGAAYYHTLRRPWRRYFPLIGMVFTALALFDYFVLSGLWQAITQTLIFSDKYATLLRYILMIGLLLLYFEQCLSELHPRSLWQDAMFVVSVGFLLFYTSTLMLFLTKHLILGPERRLVFAGLGVVNLGLHVLLARAFWLGRHPPPAVVGAGLPL